jgi:UDP-N-acetylglucosamine enolpyruvyl transferase
MPLLHNFLNRSIRPVDYRLEGLQKLGFSIRIERGIVTAKLEKKIDGVIIFLPFPGVGATEHIMTTAAILNGAHTVIENAAMEFGSKMVPVTLAVKYLHSQAEYISLEDFENLTKLLSILLEK